jgi:sirohydrochlorin ferrochelatase
MPNEAPLAADASLGIVIVDHGSRRAESNRLLEDVVAMFREVSRCANVQVAHMELAEPTIAQAFSRCVAAGASRVVVFPYFLAPGRHWSEDSPRLAAEAAASHPGVEYLVSAPLGLHQLIGQVMIERIETCVAAQSGGPLCQLCDSTPRCSHG